MTFVKKLVMQGFKSFVKKTELPFSQGINVILGPNGSGKSNVSDALCFVLGRLSVKSMRAAKAKNLIFMGSKIAAPAKEARVKIVFDNSEKTFSVEEKEVSIERIVRKNGMSIYKINNETKTRQEILALLAQAGIDPNGFNIILQGEIQNFVRMYPDERRKVIEEVSGISIYEFRKEKSLKELNKTEDKLKEVMAVLRERTAYLNNLEKERQQALRFKKLEEDVKKFKASIIYSDLTSRKKEMERINKEIEKKNKEIEKVRKIILKIKTRNANYNTKITEINFTIQKSTGLEQEKLNSEIANLRAELAGLNVKLDNLESKLSSLEREKQDLEEIITENKILIRDLEKESPTAAKKEKDVDQKKKELEALENSRKKFYMIKSELKSVRERIEDKKSSLQNYSNESNFLIKQIEIQSRELFDKKTDSKKIDLLKVTLSEKKEIFGRLQERERILEKTTFANEAEIERQNKVVEKISKMDICPLCKSKITEEHMRGINDEIKPLVTSLQKEINSADSELGEIENKKNVLNQDIEQLRTEISKRESDLMKMMSINEKQEQIKTISKNTELIKNDLNLLENRRKKLETEFGNFGNIEQKYETTLVEVQEISIRSKENINSEITFKQRELERSKISLKQIIRNQTDIEEDLVEIRKLIDSKEKILKQKKKSEEELSKRFEQMISERDSFQTKIREEENNLFAKQNEISKFDSEINNFKIEKARFDAEIENLEIEMLEFEDVGIIKTKREVLVDRLAKTKETLSRIGSVNLRSLEVYDSIKKEYDAIKDRVDIISKEKEGILKIIHEIDIKKKKVFMQTLNSLNEIFSRNFSQLSTKGQVTLDLENRKDPFAGGVNIIVKTGHGKYFDVKSLSGGEQTLVALSLIFAIQEFRPYYFYILDEIDAALDKRNSERLAGLLQKYMKKGQYIVITHNDEIISNATNLYGISMHDGISKVVSLEI